MFYLGFSRQAGLFSTLLEGGIFNSTLILVNPEPILGIKNRLETVIFHPNMEVWILDDVFPLFKLGDFLNL